MISRAGVLALFGKNMVNASIKNLKVPSVSVCYRFAEDKKKQQLASYLTDGEIREKVDQKQLTELMDFVKQLEGKELSKHNTTLARVEKQLSSEQKSRIQRISELINGLSEGEAEYFRYRVFKAVEA